MAYTCQKHDIADLTSWCPACMEAFENRRRDMTIAERVAALKAIPDQLTIPFASIHQWITELMGRDVWTHELAHPELLVSELERGEQATLTDVLSKLPHGKPTMVSP